MKRIIRDNHINAKPILTVGCVENEIPSIANEKMVDLLIFPINIKTRLNKFMLRNIIGHLVKSISCPLLMVLHNNDKQNSTDTDNLMVVKMLICCKPLLDQSSAFKNAIRISEIFSSELHLLYISNHGPRIKESQTTFHEKLIKSIKQVIPQKNQDLMQNIKIVLQKGNLIGQLLQYSRNNDIDLIFLDAIHDS